MMKMPSMKNPSKNIQVEQERLLLVEGKDEVNFFQELLKNIEYDQSIQIIDIGGVEQIQTKLKVLKNMPDFNMVRSIGIVRDSDQSMNAAIQSLQSILNNVMLPIPSTHNTFNQGDTLKVGIFIMPGDRIEGSMLEDLCLHTKQGTKILEQIEGYLARIQEDGETFPSNISKSKCLIYLASMPKIVNNLGLGVKKGYWDLDHACLEDIKSFIRNI